jgi:Mn-dependent DtxR family transcriptional regulator
MPASSESLEMYLEDIYVLSQTLQIVRPVDLAKKMGFSKPTISEWMGKLRD